MSGVLKLLPALGGLARSTVKAVIKAGYGIGTTVRQSVAEVGEEVQDLVVEARTEYDQAHREPHGTEPAATLEVRPARKRARPPEPQTT